MLDINQPISIADSVLDVQTGSELIKWLNQLEYRYYRITNRNEPDPFPIWHKELFGRDFPINQPSDYSCTDEILTSHIAPIWIQCMDSLGLPKETQCHGAYANANTFGNEGNPHIDSQHPLDRTLLIYGVSDWKMGWGGETAFFNPDGTTAVVVSPAPCRVLVFDGNIKHGVNPISKACNILRPVLVFKIRLEEPTNEI